MPERRFSNKLSSYVTDDMPMIALLGIMVAAGAFSCLPLLHLSDPEGYRRLPRLLNTGILMFSMLYEVILLGIMHIKYDEPRPSKIQKLWIIVAIIDFLLCIAILKQHSDVYIYNTILLSTQFVIYLFLKCETSIEFIGHIVNNIILVVYFKFIHESPIVRWYYIKIVINIIFCIDVLLFRLPAFTFNIANELLDVNKVPTIKIVSDFEDNYFLDSALVKSKKPAKSINIRIPTSTSFTKSLVTVSFEKLSGPALREEVLSHARSNDIDMSILSHREIKHIVLNVDFNVLLVKSRFNKKRLVTLWKDTIYQKRDQINGFDIRLFSHFNDNFGNQNDDIVKVIQSYNPMSIAEWRQLLDAYYDPLKILENIPSKYTLLTLVTGGRNHKKYFDLLTNKSEINSDILSSLSYRLLTRINKLNGYTLLERFAFSGNISDLPPCISRHMLRNISRYSRLVFRMTYRDLYPKNILWKRERSVRTSPFVNLTTHDWAALRLTTAYLDKRKTRLLNKRLIGWWMMI